MYQIVKAEKLADKIFLMEIEAPRVARACQPGQFLIVKMDEVGERIPLTICDYNREKGTMEIRDVAVRPYVAWKEHEFMFDNESLEEIMNTLSLWYDVDVFFQTASLKQLHFTGHLGRYEEVSHILDAISGVTQVKFSVKGRTIIVME